jgi:hypothetical protein
VSGGVLTERRKTHANRWFALFAYVGSPRPVGRWTRWEQSSRNLPCGTGRTLPTRRGLSLPHGNYPVSRDEILVVAGN